MTKTVCGTYWSDDTLIIYFIDGKAIQAVKHFLLFWGFFLQEWELCDLMGNNEFYSPQLIFITSASDLLC